MHRCRDIDVYVMYYIYVTSGPSLLIESTDSMILLIYFYPVNGCDRCSVWVGTRLCLMTTPPTETINLCGRGKRGLAHAHLHFRQTTRHYAGVVNMIVGLHKSCMSNCFCNSMTLFRFLLFCREALHVSFLLGA